MTATAVQIGAGNIGRGFIAQLFHESGFQVVFLDVVEPVIRAMNHNHGFKIHIVGKGEGEVPISDIRAVNSMDQDAFAREIAGCIIASTAVGARALPAIAGPLAAGLLLRYKTSGLPLNIIICENLHGAGGILRDLVSTHLPTEDREAVLARTGFVHAVVSRMVPLQETDPAELDIRVEAYKRLPVDGKAIVGVLPPIVGVEPVMNFEAHEERKLFTHNCAHATLGYLGWQLGITYGFEALAEPHIRDLLDRVMAETGIALIRKHKLDPDEHNAHVVDLMERFGNVELGDTCFRLGRDPLRKLAPGDRLVGAARLCESQSAPYEALAAVIASAFCFNPDDDPSAVQLQGRLTLEGFSAVLKDVCRIDIDEPLGRMIAKKMGL